jgi:hypothetical protein
MVDARDSPASAGERCGAGTRSQSEMTREARARYLTRPRLFVSCASPPKRMQRSVLRHSAAARSSYDVDEADMCTRIGVRVDEDVVEVADRR